MVHALCAQVTNLIEYVLDQELRARWLKWAVIGLVVFTILLLGAITGLAFGVGAALKDTDVQNNVFTARDGTPLQTASIEYVIVDGALVPRSELSKVSFTSPKARRLQESGGLDPMEAAEMLAAGAPASLGSATVVSTRAFTGIEMEFSSEMSIRDLMELNCESPGLAGGDWMNWLDAAWPAATCMCPYGVLAAQRRPTTGPHSRKHAAAGAAHACTVFVALLRRPVH